MRPWQGGDPERNYLIDWCDLAEHWRVGKAVKSIMSGWFIEVGRLLRVMKARNTHGPGKGRLFGTRKIYH